jgi:hypothetical protein
LHGSKKELNAKTLGLRERLLLNCGLARSLEQEAARLQAKGAPPVECFMTLRDCYKSASRPGRNESHALIHLIHRLQALASDYAPNLTWKRRNIPPQLLYFIFQALDAAKIKHPEFAENPSKFRRLLRKAPRKARSSRRGASYGQPPAERPGYTSPPSIWAECARLAAFALDEREPFTAAQAELELRLSKTSL